MKKIALLIVVLGMFSGCALFPGWFIAIQEFQGVDKIFTGEQNSFLIDRAGTVYGTGPGTNFQLGPNFNHIQYGFTPIYYNARMVASGQGYTMILDNNGSVWAVGTNTSKLFGPAVQMVTNWTNILNNISYIYAQHDRSYAVRNDGQLLTIGYSEHGNLGNGALWTSVSNWIEAGIGDVKKVQGNYYNTFVLKNDNTLWVVGTNYQYMFGNSIITNSLNWQQVTADVVDFSLGYEHAIVLKNDGKVYGAGNNNFGIMANTVTFPGYIQNWGQILAQDGIQVSAADNRSLVKSKNGDLWAIGFVDGVTNGDWNVTKSNVHYVSSMGMNTIISYNDLFNLSVSGYNWGGEIGLPANGEYSNWTDINLKPGFVP